MTEKNQITFTVSMTIQDATRADGDAAIDELIEKLKTKLEGCVVTVRDNRRGYAARKDDKLISKPEDDPVADMDFDELFED